MRAVSAAVGFLLFAPVAIASAAPFAGDVEIGGGRSLYMECRGSGAPTVILEAGLRTRGDVWSAKLVPGQPVSVFGRLSKLTRVCEYDRPGTITFDRALSRSDPVAMPRTAADTVADLQALLRAAPIRGPVVLVGHSMGGLIVRLYAATHPRRVAGMVEVDALAERMQHLLSADRFAQYAALNSGPLPGLGSYGLEAIDFARSFAQMRRAHRRSPPAELPLTVVSKGLPFGISPELGAEFERDVERAWDGSQRWLAGLVDDAPSWIATRSGHYVMLDQPRIVVRAVRRVVHEARR